MRALAGFRLVKIASKRLFERVQKIWFVPNRQCLIDSVYPLDPIDSI